MFVLGQRSSLLPITKDLTFYVHNNLVNGGIGIRGEVTGKR
ncbi:hypothetical protein COO91_02363 [Nostoc flagelliforme CCNUN1]|uniref:Uncharacterized protein n=1 Tax=Nostoc flagelliforme CCNUN1 TaxID=2038116 RepID=A0A2K8SLY7_9NOSO|nr:hypothetical protein COO91_02363 [Nostoc flagelliforme CCNUN1]